MADTVVQPIAGLTPFITGDIFMLEEYGDRVTGGGVAVQVLRPIGEGRAPVPMRTASMKDHTILIADASIVSVHDMLQKLFGIDLKPHPIWRSPHKQILIVQAMHEPFLPIAPQ